ncbi:MAG: hypothetical protein LBL44_00575, partial [Treponema sp.]|nr:hypothetical protein [Treponema sp.]
LKNQTADAPEPINRYFHKNPQFDICISRRIEKNQKIYKRARGRGRRLFSYTGKLPSFGSTEFLLFIRLSSVFLRATLWVFLGMVIALITGFRLISPWSCDQENITHARRSENTAMTSNYGPVSASYSFADFNAIR